MKINGFLMIKPSR